LIVPSRESLETQVDGELQVVLVDLEALGPSAAHEQQLARFVLVAECLREPAAQRAQRLGLPRLVRAAGEDDDVPAGTGHHLHPVESPRASHLQHAGFGPVDDVRHRELRHRTHAAPPFRSRSAWSTASA